MLFGWDVSTAVVGVAVFTDAGKFQKAYHVDLKKYDHLNTKMDVLRMFIKEIHTVWGQESQIDTHFVEDRLAGFSGGGSNAGTIMRLAAFNAMACWCLHDIWKDKTGEIVMLHPSTVKAIMKRDGLIIPKGSKEKKKLTLQHVQRVEPSFVVEYTKKGNPQPWCYDRSDAYITGRAGQLIQRRDAE